ncbi:sensor histidine kinase [Brevibacterium oceani]|uniref:sensor histidine kinase n=1 Tax=Brevibacterium oceani TaxID=358099 RepID=UPI0015E72982|nr:histidine kinase [Brevibacterium oceani]
MSGNERHSMIVDTIIAVALALVSGVSAAVLTVEAAPPRPADWLAYVLIVLACGPLAVRRRFPVAVLAVSTVAVSVYLILGYPYSAIMLAVSLAVYSVCRRISLRPALLLSTGALLLLIAHIFVNPAALPGLYGVIPAAAWIAVPTTVGISRRLVLDARARERAADERRLREQERLRLAQEVHDVVGHGLSAIQMQADIALHLAETKPEQGITALRAISTASSSALVELREALRAVDPADDGKAAAPRSPAAGLARLDDLCSRIRAAGVEVELRIRGRQRALPAALDLAVYRIVQEALTNVVRHAVSPHAYVAIDHLGDGREGGESGVTVTVTSPHDGSAIVEGIGIGGIRRRVTALGGRVTIRAGETLRIQATLPEVETREIRS